MQTKTKPLIASPMEELDETHQLEIQILKLKNLGYTIVRGCMERYWDDEPVVFGAGHGHCLFEYSPAHQAWHNDARVNKTASDMTPPIYIRLSFLIENLEEDMGPTAL